MLFWEEVEQISRHLPQWLSLAATSVGLAIAYSASRTWESTLKNKRGDELLAATFDLVGEIGAMRSAIDRKVSSVTYGACIDRLYSSRLSLQKAFIIAERSYPLDENNLRKIRIILDNTDGNMKGMHDNDGRPIGHKFESAEMMFVNVEREADAFRCYVRSVVC